jgi:hypothetical protein
MHQKISKNLFKNVKNSGFRDGTFFLIVMSFYEPVAVLQGHFSV